MEVEHVRHHGGARFGEVRAGDLEKSRGRRGGVGGGGGRDNKRMTVGENFVLEVEIRFGNEN
jgi:hypothetical protein